MPRTSAPSSSPGPASPDRDAAARRGSPKGPIARRTFSEIERISADLAQTDPLIWPWRFSPPRREESNAVVCPGGGRGRLGNGPAGPQASRRQQYGGGEFGAVSYQPNAIGFREFRRIRWESLSARARPSASGKRRVHGLAETPTAMEAELQPAVEQLMAQIQRIGTYAYRELRLDLASERFRVDLWNKWGLDVVRALLSAYDAERRRSRPRSASLRSPRWHI